MAKDTITITIQGEACTISIEPGVDLRVKGYHDRKSVVLQGYDTRRFPHLTSYTFPALKRDVDLLVDAYSGDGEAELLHNVYVLEESGLVLKHSSYKHVEVHIEQEPIGRDGFEHPES